MLIGIDANEANLTKQRVGINQFAFRLLHALSRITSSHKFILYLKSSPLPDLPPESPSWKYRVIPFPALWTQTRLPYDLYTHKPRPAVFLSLTHYAPRFAPIPVVICIMDLGFLSSPEQFTSTDYNQLKNWTAYSVKKATKIITISNYTRDDISHHYMKNPTDISVIYPGVDSNFVKNTNSSVEKSILSKYQITKPFILSLGSLKPSKNIENLIQAFAQNKHKDRYTLVIAGKKAWYYTKIFELTQKLKLEHKIKFIGYIEDQEVPVLMSCASAFAMPSLFEGFGIPALEAMACGTPVVTSGVASLPEVVGEAGIYVDPLSVDSIDRGLSIALENPQRYIKLGLKRVKSFSYEIAATQTLDLLNSISL